MYKNKTVDEKKNKDKNKLPNKVSKKKFNKLSLCHALKNIDDPKYDHLITKQKNDFNLSNYLDITKRKSSKEYKLILKFKNKKHPKYTELVSYNISSINGDNTVFVKKLSKNKLKNMKNNNKFIFHLDDIGQKYIYFNIFLGTDEKKYPELLDINLIKKYKV